MDRRRSLLKIAALRTEREHQQGVDASKGYLETTSEGLFFEGPRTLECYFNFQHADKEQLPAEYTISMMGFELSRSDYLAFHCGGNNVQVPLTVGNDYHAVISYNGSIAECYLNGNLVRTVIPRSYVVVSKFRIGALNYPPTGYVYFCRHYNYALSAEEVAALYNDGDPAGYVLPVPYKFKVADYISDFSKNADGWFVPSSYPGVSINAGDGILSVSGDSTTLVIQNQNMASGDKASIFRVRITFAVPFTGSRVQFFAHSYNYYADLTLSSDKLNAEGVVYINEASISYNVSYMYLYDVPIGDVVKISTITIESVGCIAEYLPQNILVSRKRDFPHVSFPGAGYNPASGVFIGNSQSATRDQYNIPQANGFSGNYMRFDAITVVSLYCAYWYYYTRASVPIKVTFEYRSNTTIYSSQTSINPSAADSKIIGEPNEGNPKIISVTYGLGAAAYLFSKPNLPDAWLEMRVLSIEILEGICLKWYDSAKQLPLNDEYLPPLLEPIVIGDATPVRITGNNSYTWTGADDPIRNFRIRLSHSSIPGQVYRVKYTISNYEAGLPAIWICGTTVSHLPAENGTRTIIITSQHSADLCDLYGGGEGTDRRLTFTLDSVEPVLERGYDLTAVGTPEIPAYSWLASSWMMKEPMSLDDLIVYPGGTVPPAIVDGALRITCNEKVGSYGGGGRYSKIIDARPGDSVEWGFQIRSSRSLEAMISLSVEGRLYYIKVTNCTPEWQQYSYVTPIAVNPATDFWISKAYNDANPGWIDIKNITIKVYRK